MNGSLSRIVSLVPCLTHTLLAMGGRGQLKGVTRYCPTGHEAAVVGGIHDLDFQLIAQLEPDLVLVDAEENGMGNVLELAERFEVLAVSAGTVLESLDTVAKFSRLTGRTDLGDEFRRCFERFSTAAQVDARSATLVWLDPLRCAGSDTYCGALLEHIGVATVFEGPGYPDIDQERLLNLAPDLLLLPSEPFKFDETHICRFEALLEGSGTTVLPVDGKALFWYGAYMLEALATLPRVLRR